MKGRGPASSLPQYLHRSDAFEEPGNHTDGQTFKLDNATTLQALNRLMAGQVLVSWIDDDQKLSGSISDVQNGRTEGLPILQPWDETQKSWERLKNSRISRRDY